jgi:hypothetical protein
MLKLLSSFRRNFDKKIKLEILVASRYLYSDLAETIRKNVQYLTIYIKQNNILTHRGISVQI